MQKAEAKDDIFKASVEWNPISDKISNWTWLASLAISALGRWEKEGLSLLYIKSNTSFWYQNLWGREQGRSWLYTHVIKNLFFWVSVHRKISETAFSWVRLSGKKSIDRGLERWLSSWEHMMLSQRTQVLSPLLQHQSTTICNRGGYVLFCPLQAPGTHVADRHACKQNTNTHKVLFFNFKKGKHWQKVYKLLTISKTVL